MVQQDKTALGYLRAALYYLAFYPATVFYSVLCVVVARPLPFRQRFKFVTQINYFYIAWLRICCGVKLQVEGLENLPKEGAYVAISNHQSEWETIYFQILIRPQCIVLKKEILKMPFFGWAMGLLDPIALDRSQKRGALKALLSEGKDRLGRGIPIVIFPQGTRLAVGERGKFNKGGAMLAVSSEVPVVPIAHNAGVYWPGKSFIKYPGTIILRIGKPVASVGRSVDEVHAESVGWLLEQMDQLEAPEATKV
ncbi:lysophospholipid acyltransferase family protein [Neptunomonas antarctica]|uniref:1-acyl-sn-glycerol-3-phosphate acyltransferase n=1 Tax=Neptunomonas antarctica TaxID=619304 RepID=A0A1N7MH87_9GAMM|nr:lysophospholipid acyltransferase family protein [Neptunomonas antarctica]SIS85423.1 1-acyl-sn-glycerol-3-phosphate acyltransferase [Neptunomonas antarctica]